MNIFFTRFAAALTVNTNQIRFNDLTTIEAINAIVDAAEEQNLPRVNNAPISRETLAARALDMYRVFERDAHLINAYAIHVNVYRAAPIGDNFLDQDCTLGGVTSKYARLVAETKRSTHIRMFDAMLYVGIEQVLVLGEAGGATHYKPATHLLDGKWHMFGGNFVYTSDSRFESQPVGVHDRVESY